MKRASVATMNDEEHKTICRSLGFLIVPCSGKRSLRSGEKTMCPSRHLRFWTQYIVQRSNFSKLLSSTSGKEIPTVNKKASNFGGAPQPRAASDVGMMFTAFYTAVSRFCPCGNCSPSSPRCGWEGRPFLPSPPALPFRLPQGCPVVLPSSWPASLPQRGLR